MFEVDIYVRTPSCVIRGFIDAEQRAAIEKQLIRMCNTRLNSVSNEWFVLRDIVGGNNRDFAGTNFQIIYDKYLIEYGDRQIAYSKTAQDMGWFLKNALKNDNKIFTCGYLYRAGKRLRAYRLLQ